MNLFIYILFILSLTNNINNIIIFSATSFFSKIIYNKTSIKNNINNILVQLKLNNFLNKNKILNKNFYLYIYKNKIVLIGNSDNVKDILLVKKIIKKKYKKYIIHNNILCNKKTNDIFINNILLYIKIFFNLFYNKTIKISKYKVFIKNNKIFFIIFNFNKNLYLIKKIKNKHTKIEIINIKS